MIIKSHWKMMMAISFAFIIFCFWCFLYPHAVVGQERLFVWDTEFWQEYGIYQYIRDFFLQFFHFAWLGALLLALVCLMAQGLTFGCLTWKLVKREVFFSSIDEKGKATKPFLLPQKNPRRYYHRTLYSFNTPDFISSPLQ